MYASTVETIEPSASKMDELLQRARSLKRSHASFKNLHQLEQELRLKRKALIGTSVPLTSIVGAVSDGQYALDYASVVELTEFLSACTCAYWAKPHAEAMHFCRQFFKLCIVGVANPAVAHQCLDDLILLSHVLSCDSKVVFEDVMMGLLDDQYHDSLRDFLAGISEDFLDATFERGVLAAAAVLLGSLPSPLHKEE